MKAVKVIGYSLTLLPQLVSALKEGGSHHDDVGQTVTDRRNNLHKMTTRDICHKDESDDNPFCSPTSDDVWRLNKLYTISWDPRFCVDGCILELHYDPSIDDEVIKKEVIESWTLESGNSTLEVLTEEKYLYSPILLYYEHTNKGAHESDLLLVLSTPDHKNSWNSPIFQIKHDDFEDLSHLTMEDKKAIFDLTWMSTCGACVVGFLLYVVIATMLKERRERKNMLQDSSAFESDNDEQTTRATRAKPAARPTATQARPAARPAATQARPAATQARPTASQASQARQTKPASMPRPMPKAKLNATPRTTPNAISRTMPQTMPNTLPRTMPNAQPNAQPNAMPKGPGLEWKFWQRWDKGYTGRKVRRERLRQQMDEENQVELGDMSSATVRKGTDNDDNDDNKDDEGVRN